MSFFDGPSVLEVPLPVLGDAGFDAPWDEASLNDYDGSESPASDSFIDLETVEMETVNFGDRAPATFDEAGASVSPPHASPVPASPEPAERVRRTASSPKAKRTPSALSLKSRRESHQKLEQKRRERASEYFADIKALLPSSSQRKEDKNSLLDGAVRLIKQLRAEVAEARSGAPHCSASSCQFHAAMLHTPTPTALVSVPTMTVMQTNRAFEDTSAGLASHGSPLANLVLPADLPALSTSFHDVTSGRAEEASATVRLHGDDDRRAEVTFRLVQLPARRFAVCYVSVLE